MNQKRQSKFQLSAKEAKMSLAIAVRKGKEKASSLSEIQVYLVGVMGRWASDDLAFQFLDDIKSKFGVTEEKKAFSNILKALEEYPKLEESFLDFLVAQTNLRCCSGHIPEELEECEEDFMKQWMKCNPITYWVEKKKVKYRVHKLDCKECKRTLSVPYCFNRSHTHQYSIWRYEHAVCEEDTRAPDAELGFCSIRHPGLKLVLSGRYVGCLRINDQKGWKVGDELCSKCLRKGIADESLTQCFAH